jgi:hypothetical protein
MENILSRLWPDKGETTLCDLSPHPPSQTKVSLSCPGTPPCLTKPTSNENPPHICSPCVAHPSQASPPSPPPLRGGWGQRTKTGLERPDGPNRLVA